jgi:hypothetical protein
MLKKQIRTLGHKAIVKNNKSHQEAFDELSQNENIDKQLLANELSKIPSNGKQKSTASLRYIFIAALVLLAAIRIIGIIMIGMESSVNMGLVYMLVAFGVLIPGLGVYAALFGKSELYMTTGILLGISLFRSVSRGELNVEPETLVALIPFAVAIGLAFFIPFKLKTPHKRVITESYVDGKLVKKVDYEFEDTRLNESDILDSTF